MKLTELYLEKQGRPDSKTPVDLEKRGLIIPPGTVKGVSLDPDYEETLVKHGDVDDAPVDGATDEPVSSNWASDHVDAQDEKDYIQDSLIKAVLTVILNGDWTDVDVEEIDWEEIANTKMDIAGLSGLLADDQHVLDAEVEPLAIKWALVLGG